MSNISGIFDPVSKSITYDTLPLYEYRDMWAEEAGGASDNSFQWSYGNGARGYIGLPVDEGWELIAMYFQADNGGAATESMQVRLVDIGATPSTAAPDIYVLNIPQAGQGIDNNSWIYENLSAPVAIPDNTFIGFRTGDEVGAWSDMRVGIRMRRKIGDYVSHVYLQ